jgi:hypothetical protein
MFARKIAIVLLAFVLLACGQAPDPKAKLNPKPKPPESSVGLRPEKEAAPSDSFSSARKFAFLISGNTEERHEKNLALVYKTLLWCGFGKENIYILDGEGRKNSRYAVDGRANRKNIRAVFTDLQRRMNDGDFLFIYTTDHGGRDMRTFPGRGGLIKVSTLSLPGSEKDLDEIEFAEYVDRLKFRIGVFVFDQCLSGGFAERAAGRNRITISACKRDEDSDDNTFPQTFFKSFRLKAADLNKDGRVSVRETFLYTLKNDRNTVKGKQTPQIFQGIESEVFLK